MATKTNKTKATASKAKTVSKKEVQSLASIREAANLAWNSHFTTQNNVNWMLASIAESNPGLVYYWNPTNIGLKLKKCAASVNQLLENMGFQERSGKSWKLTPQGEKYAVLRPFEVKHEGVEYPVSGQQILWSLDVIPLIRAWLKGPQKPVYNFNADMSAQELLDELLKMTEKTVTDELSATVPMQMDADAATEIATKLYAILRKHWKYVTCNAQPRKQGSAIQIKVLAPKPEGATEPKTITTTVTTQAKMFTPAEGMSNQELVSELLKLAEKSTTDEFSLPVHVDMELEKAQELALQLHTGLCKHWKSVACYARSRKQGATIQLKVLCPKVQAETEAAQEAA